MQLFPADDRPTLASTRALAQSLLLAALVGALAGTAGAGFLRALNAITQTRFEHPWLLWLLPLAGLISAWAYRHVGGPSERGNNLIIEEIHQPGGGVPSRMAPLVLGATLLTHLCGGSAGREGTAVQMGGALASGVKKWLRLGAEHQAMLRSAGVAGGFGAVFGTPLAGAVFALEVLVRGRISYTWLGPCLVAALTGDQVCAAWGIHHEDYGALAALARLREGPALPALVQAAALGLAFGLCSRLFVATAPYPNGGCARCSAAWRSPA